MEQTKKEGIRINKYLSDAGVCSRRAADKEIASGNVRIDGRLAVNGDQVLPGMVVTYKGKTLTPVEQKVVLAFHKPVGIVCTAEKREKNNVIDYINYPMRIYPVGRLDKESEGLLLLTNDGELMNRILKARNGHEKEYVVTVDKPITADFLKQMSNGLYLEELDVTTRKCKVTKKSDHSFVIILTQGYNRQIRRMCEACGYQVTRLYRKRIMNIRIGDLKPGAYRNLTKEELAILYHSCGMTCEK